MRDAHAGDRDVVYDRTLLLGQPKRNQVLDLWEVQKYGVDSFSDAEYLCIYGLKPSEWFARGIRLLARTAVECTRDQLGDLIGKDVARIASTETTTTGSVVVDPFAGSGNTLFWIVRNVAGSKGIGFEIDDSVYAVSSKNLSLVDVKVELALEDYETGVERLAVPPDALVIVYVAPPWGDALNEDTGLDLRRTRPPVREIVGFMGDVFKSNKVLYAIQIYETVDQASLDELQRRFDWWELRIYDINAPGTNHGILLGTKGWSV